MEKKDSIANEPFGVELRPWSEGDLPLLERLMGDPAMTEHLGGPETPEKIRERHARYLRAGAGGMFAIIVGGSGKLPAGSIGYWERAWRGQTVWETGWSVLPEFQGQGVATRAAAALVDRVRVDGLHRFLHAFPAVDNPPSNAICRKLGFTLLEQVDFEYPPGRCMRCNDWALDLSPSRKKKESRTRKNADGTDKKRNTKSIFYYMMPFVNLYGTLCPLW